MFRTIQTDSFAALLYANASGDQACDAVANQCTHYCNRNGNQNAGQLGEEQMGFSEKQAVSLSDIIDGRLSKQTCTDAAPDTANAVTSKGIQGIIVAELLFCLTDSKETNRSCNRTNQER